MIHAALWIASFLFVLWFCFWAGSIVLSLLLMAVVAIFAGLAKLWEKICQLGRTF